MQVSSGDVVITFRAFRCVAFARRHLRENCLFLRLRRQILERQPLQALFHWMHSGIAQGGALLLPRVPVFSFVWP